MEVGRVNRCSAEGWRARERETNGKGEDVAHQLATTASHVGIRGEERGGKALLK